MLTRFIVSLISVGVLLESVSAETLDELESKWDVQRSSLQSFYITCRTVQRSVTVKMHRDDVYRLLSKNFAVDDDVLRDVARTLDTTLLDDNEPWGIEDFAFDFDSARHDLTCEGITTSRVWHRDLLITKEPRNNQISLQHRATSGLQFPRIEDFVFMLPAGSLKKATVESKDGRLLIRRGPERLEVDEETGLVERYELGNYGHAPYTEIIQDGATMHDDVAVPAWRFEGKYRGPQLRFFALRIIDDIDLKRDIDDDQFAISAEPNSKIVDGRSDPPKVRRISGYARLQASSLTAD